MSLRPGTITRSSAEPSLARYGPILVVLLAAALALVFQGTRPLWEPDEGRYTNVALEMLRSGDFLVPRLHPELPHFTKPPVTYWLLAASLGGLGRSSWAARLPLALAFVGVVLLVLRLGRWLTPERPWLPPLVYATTLLPFVAANVVTTDTFLALATALAGVGFASWFLGRSEGRSGVRIMWLGYGLAFLTKGPPGLVSLLAFLAAAGLHHKRRRIREIFDPIGLLLFVGIALPWFLLVVARDRGLLEYFLVDEVAKRIGTGAHDRNSEWYAPISVYGPTLLLGSLPWTPWLLGALPGAWRGFRSLVRRRVDAIAAEDLLLGLWIVVPLAVFALAQSRLAFYLLPLFAPLAVVVARRIPQGWERLPHAKWLLGLWVAVLLAVKLWGAGYPPPDGDPRQLASLLRETGPVREVAFVESRPMYALNLYLDAEVEPILFASEAGGRFEPDTLAEELGEDEADRVFVVRSDQAERFLATVEELGFSPSFHGDFGDKELYRVTGASHPPGAG